VNIARKSPEIGAKDKKKKKKNQKKQGKGFIKGRAAAEGGEQPKCICAKGGTFRGGIITRESKVKNPRKKGGKSHPHPCARDHTGGSR